jgi:hypothetical protein
MISMKNMIFIEGWFDNKIVQHITYHNKYYQKIGVKEQQVEYTHQI